MNKLNIYLIGLVAIVGLISTLTLSTYAQSQSQSEQPQLTGDDLRALGWNVTDINSDLKTICEQLPSATNTSFAFRASYSVTDCLPVIKEIVPDQPMNVQFDQLENNKGFIIFITLN